LRDFRNKDGVINFTRRPRNKNARGLRHKVLKAAIRPENGACVKQYRAPVETGKD